MNTKRMQLLGAACALSAMLPAAAQEVAKPAEPTATETSQEEGEPGEGFANPETTQDEAASRANAVKWDADGDGTISGAEFMASWEERDLFRQWDANGDGNLTSEELARGFLDRYDEDGSNALEEYEQDDIGREMGADGFFGQGDG